MRTLLQKAQHLLPRMGGASPASAPQRPPTTTRPDVFQVRTSAARPVGLAQPGPQRAVFHDLSDAKLQLVRTLAEQTPGQRADALLQQLRQAAVPERGHHLASQLRETAPALRRAYLEQALGSLTDAQEQALIDAGARGTTGRVPLEVPDRATLERAIAELVPPRDAEPKPYDGPVFDGVTPAPGTTNTQAGLPLEAPLTNAAGERSPAAYDNVLNQFAVETNPRYAIRDSSGDGVADTFCNIFASDAMRAMGVELPHWVNPDGSPAEPYADGARELSANGGHEWLETHGATYGWREVSAEEAQARANAGEPTVVSMEQPGGIGHIAVVRPGELTAEGPAIAQAGLANTNNTHVQDAFGDQPVKYYVNDQGSASAPPVASGDPSTALPSGAGASVADGLPMSSLPGRPVPPPEGLARGDGGEDVLALQQVLVAEGFLTEEQLATGPGTFGPRTEAALRAYQQAHGLPATGYYGPMTEASMSSSNATSSPTTNSTANPGLSASGAGGTQATSAGAGGARHEVPYISQIHSEGTADDWNANSNCGPASIAMIARAFGHGEGMSDGTLINSLGGSIGIGELGTGWDGVVRMAEGLGLSAEHRPGSDLAWIDEQLASGELIAANGDRGVTLANSNTQDGITGGHWIVIIGKDADGNYLVQDPSTDCKVLTPSELERFLDSRQPDGGHLVAVGP